MRWLAFGANLTILLSYLGITWLILAGQVKAPTASGLLVAAIFFTCGVGHGLHAVHLLGWLGPNDVLHAAVVDHDEHITPWDTLTAAVAVAYFGHRYRTRETHKNRSRAS